MPEREALPSSAAMLLRQHGQAVCVRRFRVFNRNRASQIMTEAEQQRKAATGSMPSAARLRIAKPSFGDEIVQEGM